MKRIMLALLLLPMSIYLAMVVALYVYQRNLQYFPDTQRRSPAEVGASGFLEVTLRTTDGLDLIAWYKPAPAGRPTILYFHGNGGSVSTRWDKNTVYGEKFGVLAVDYRGYGGNPGTPSEESFVADGHVAYDWLVSQGISSDKILMLGESIGTGVAVQVTAAKPVRAIALEAPYANAVDIGAERYWFMPVRLLMKDQFRSADHIKQIKAPLFIIHGNKDRVVPFAQGRKLFELANEPKQFIEVPDAGHGMIGDEAIWRRVLEFFEAQAQP
jgi:uncharacterized protein